MFPKDNIAKLLNIKYPIIQGGMVWVSGAKLAAACANAGILGVIGAGSMKPELLKQHLNKANQLTNTGTLAVNVPLLYEQSKEQIQCALDAGIKVFITSAGSPKKYTSWLKDQGCTVIHVTSSPELALKCEVAGVDAIVAEGFEAGGHNGRDEITTLCLIPQVVKAVKIPVIAAGGIATGTSIFSALSLGAAGVQMGTRFLMSQESSAHENYKKVLEEASSNATKLSLKKHVPVRLYKNDFFKNVFELEQKGASIEELVQLLGKGRAKRGMLEGDIKEGELEVGQICGLLDSSPTVAQIVADLISDYNKTHSRMLIS